VVVVEDVVTLGGLRSLHDRTRRLIVETTEVSCCCCCGCVRAELDEITLNGATIHT